MEAVKVMGTIDQRGQLTLDQSLEPVEGQLSQWLNCGKILTMSDAFSMHVEEAPTFRLNLRKLSKRYRSI